VYGIVEMYYGLGPQQIFEAGGPPVSNPQYILNHIYIMSVFFRKVNINSSRNTATVIVSSAPLSNKETSIAGMAVATRSQSNIVFGVLSLIDPDTGETMRANHPTITAIQKSCNIGDELEGFQMTDNVVKDMITGEPTTLVWVEAV